MKDRMALGLVLAMTIGASTARADGPIRKVIPPGGGLDALDLKLDVAAGVLRFRRCRAPDCSDTGALKELPIPIERTRIDVAASTIELVPIGEGRQVARVRIPDAQRKDLAFEAVFSGQSETPIFAGLTGYTKGEDGDRSGNVVLVYDRDATSKFVIVAEAREDTRICGQASTPLGPRGLDAKTMQLRGATLHRIDKKARDAAQRVVAQARTSTVAPLARVLVATGGSAPGSAALTDGKVDTAWTEQRPGDGHGEFATMRAPSELPLQSLVVTIAPRQPKADGAAPRTFFVATDDRLFQVTMPEDAWTKPELAYDIPLPEPVRTTCVAIVLDEAYGRGNDAPEVTIAELAAVTKFDVEGATLADVAQALSTPRGDEAAALLRRAGEAGLAATAAAYPKLDARGRAFAVDVASSAGTCEGPAAELLTRALADAESEVRRRALGRLERCGKSAAGALVIAVRSDEEPRRAAAAPLLAAVAPATAVDTLADQLGKGTVETRRAVRGAFARAAASASRDKLLALVTQRELPAIARLDLLRAAGPKLAELRPEVDVAIADILHGAPDMPTRYLLAQPLASLARTPDATSGELSRLAELTRRDPDHAVRARAAELSAGIGPLLPSLVAAASDPAPRVREAALKALGSASVGVGVGVAAQASKSDEWTFVRVAATDALGTMPQDVTTTNAIVAALGDPSPKVRVSALGALGRHKVTSQAARVRERLDDPREDPEVRALAARTLGGMCVQNAADRLTKLALNARAPVDEADERIGMAAIEALGALHPADLEARLAPLRAKDARLPLRRAADRALADAGTCR